MWPQQGWGGSCSVLLLVQNLKLSSLSACNFLYSIKNEAVLYSFQPITSVITWKKKVMLRWLWPNTLHTVFHLSKPSWWDRCQWCWQRQCCERQSCVWKSFMCASKSYMLFVGTSLIHYCQLWQANYFEAYLLSLKLGSYLLLIISADAFVSSILHFGHFVTSVMMTNHDNREVYMWDQLTELSKGPQNASNKTSNPDKMKRRC